MNNFRIGDRVTYYSTTTYFGTITRFKINGSAVINVTYRLEQAEHIAEGLFNIVISKSKMSRLKHGWRDKFIKENCCCI